MPAGRRGVGVEAGGDDLAQGRGTRGHGELVAAEGAGVGAGLPDVELGAVEDHRERQAPADRLGEHDDVGLDAGVLEGEEPAGPADPGLHLVDDEGDPALGGQPAHRPQPVVGRRVAATLALNALEDHPCDRRDAAVGVVEETLDVAHRDPRALDAADPERAAVRRGEGQEVHLARGAGDRRADRHRAARRQRPRGHPVVAAAEGEDGPPAGRGAHELERGLDRVGARGTAEVDTDVPIEAAGDVDEEFLDEAVLDRGGEVEGVEREAAVEDGADRRQHHRVVVSEGEGARAGEAVEVGAALGVDEVDSLAAHERQRERARVGPRVRLPPRLVLQEAPGDHGLSPAAASPFSLGSPNARA